MSGNDDCRRPCRPGSYEDMGGGELYRGISGPAPVVCPTGMVSSPAIGIAGGGGPGSSSAHGSSGACSRSSSSRRSVPGRLSRSLTGRSSARPVSVRNSGASAASSARHPPGAGPVSVLDVPRPDPRAAVMASPEVPERKRFCSCAGCGAPSGRPRGDRPGRTEPPGPLDNAAEHCRLVRTTGPSRVSAAFGLARVQSAAGNYKGPARTPQSVAQASIHCTAARVAAVRAGIRRRAVHEPLLDDPSAVASQVAALVGFGLDALRRELLSTEVLGTALDWVLSGSPGSGPSVPHAPSAPLGGTLDERDPRFGLERSYRVLARRARRGEERIELVERANRYHPRTWV